MRIGAFAPFSNPFTTKDTLRALGPACEERGFHSIWAAEHVVLFDEYQSRYPYAADGKIPAGGENGILDPFVTLSLLASVTSTIRLGTGICLVPQRNPVYTAKEAATVDYLSDGRLRYLQNARVANIEGAGHWVHHDRLDRFLEIVGEFLAD